MKNPLVEIKNANVFVNGTRVLHSLNWTMKTDENWAVVGNNGAGKTTFMKLVFGELIPVHGGVVRWFGHKSLTPLAEVREKVGFVSAEYQESYGNHVAGWEVVASGLFSSVGLYEAVSEKQKKATLEWMDFMGIRHLASTPFGRISYGEARRILLARALINRPSLLILDEPCTGLDIPTRERFLETLQKLSGPKTRMVYVTHRIDEIMPFITHVLYLKNGKVFAEGEKGDLLIDKTLSGALGCPIRLQNNSGRFWVTDIQPKQRKRPGKILNFLPS